MRWIPFFGSDDDDGVEKIDLRNDNAESDDGSDVRIVSNVSDSNIEVIGADGVSTSDAGGGFNVHTISMTGDNEGSAIDGGTESTRKSAPEPTAPSSPSADPEPSSDPYSSGTFVVPDNRDFMQKLEARGKNGHSEIVETVYVLTGPTYTRPTDLIRLDNEEYYGSATKTSVSFNPRSMAQKVASLYPDDEPPKLIARFHTHPGGTLRPSSADKRSAPKVERSFENAFGTDDFEFFHGIHGLEEHGRNPGPDERQAPSDSRGHICWLGERYRHKLAVYGDGFQKQKDVGIY